MFSGKCNFKIKTKRVQCHMILCLFLINGRIWEETGRCCNWGYIWNVSKGFGLFTHGEKTLISVRNAGQRRKSRQAIIPSRPTEVSNISNAYLNFTVSPNRVTKKQNKKSHLLNIFWCNCPKSSSSKSLFLFHFVYKALIGCLIIYKADKSEYLSILHFY